MLEDIRKLPTICEDVLKSKITLPHIRKVKNIVVAGMGGSAIAGEIVKDSLELTVSMETSRGYALPSYADKNTLLICISYSGNTIETLARLESGMKNKCNIVGITSGGAMASMLKKNKLPIVNVPQGMLTRVAFPYLLFSLINTLKKLGLVKANFSFEILKKHVNKIEKRAKVIAKKLKGRFPIICSEWSSVAMRLKTQLNENAKMLAKYEVLPELNHNEIESWRNLDRKFSIIFLRDADERIEIKKSVETIKSIVKNKASVIEIFAKGETRLEKILYLIWFADLLSYFAAVENKIDPYKTALIEKLKTMN